MSKKTVYGAMLLLFTISILSYAFDIQPAKSEPSTITVPDDYPTIQEAINHANAGDTIFVRSGTYYEHDIVVNKPLSLIGENKYTTIIDAEEKSYNIVIVVADNVRIGGFTIQHSMFGGRAILLDNYVNSTIYDNIITDDSDGIRILHSHGNVIRDNIVKNNRYNTGIGFDWAYNNTVRNNTVINNHIGIGAGAGYGPDEEPYNNTFLENTIRGNDYGFYGAIYNSTFFHNNFVDNVVQAAFYESYIHSPNFWDNGYPSGGNYWSDYNPPDKHYGPYQNETGSDGIGDIPYTIDANNTDKYPLIFPYGYVHSPDFNNDGIIDIMDLVRIALAYGSMPGMPIWNPYVDLNQDSIIDIFDLVTCAVHYGEKYP